MSEFPTDVVRAAAESVGRCADRMCRTDREMSVKPKTQFAMAALEAGFRMAGELGVSPEDLVKTADRIDRWLEDAARPAPARRPLKVVRQVKEAS